MIFYRFGEIPKNEKSYIWRGEEKIGEEKYQVLLDKGQSMIISKNQKNQTMLEVSSGEYHRSVIDFFINYEFLVPLMVRKA